MILPMMINQSMNESVYASNIPHEAYEFMSENFVEIDAEFRRNLIHSQACINETYVYSNEIMMEAAMTADDTTFDMLSESAFSSMIEGVKKFFKKVIEMIKGVIKKLEAFFYKLTGKTDKWLSIMRPKINAVSGKSGSSELQVTGWEYDQGYIIGKFDNCHEAVMAAWKKYMDEGFNEAPNLSSIDTVKAYRNGDRDAVTGNNEIKQDPKNPRSGDDPKVKGEVEDYNESKKKIEEATAKLKEDFPSILSGILKLGSNNSMESLYSDLVQKAHKGNSEKTTHTVTDPAGMMNAIEQSKKTISDIKKAYNTHIKTLSKYESDVDKLSRENMFKESETKDIPSAIKSAAGECMRVALKHLTDTTSLYENALGSLRTHNTNLIQEMVSQYMTDLTKYANYKESKKS